jgi:hypothetical protein
MSSSPFLDLIIRKHCGFIWISVAEDYTANCKAILILIKRIRFLKGQFCISKKLRKVKVYENEIKKKVVELVCVPKW